MRPKAKASPRRDNLLAFGFTRKVYSELRNVIDVKGKRKRDVKSFHRKKGPDLNSHGVNNKSSVRKFMSARRLISSQPV